MLLLNDNAFRFFKEALKQSLEQNGARSESVKCPLSIWIYRVFSVNVNLALFTSICVDLEKQSVT